MQSLSVELQEIGLLAKRLGLCENPNEPFATLRDFPAAASLLALAPAPHISLLPEFAMVYALTSRSQSYFDALLHEGLAPSFVLILGEGEEVEPLKARMRQFGIVAHSLANKEINAQDVMQTIMHLPQRHIIYSGYGGGILHKKYFCGDKNFLHIHAGKLPQYKGSTTCYYTLLDSSEICATALFLNPSLDGGDVLAHYRLEIEQIRALQNTDIDTSVEPYIRAQALIAALRLYRQKGAFVPTPQSALESSTTYYKIHPVLKHLALFKVFGHHGALD